MSEIEWARASELERIARGLDVGQMKLRAAPHELGDRRHLAGREPGRLAAQPLKERAIANERHLDCLGHPRDEIPAIEGLEKTHVVDDRERW
jgi:hypothetical protein